MPIFEYKCGECEKVFEVLQLAGQEKGIKCPDCGGSNLKKLISAPFLPSSVGRPANDDLGRCCNGNPGEKGCAAAGSCCGQELQ
ncbi:MAG: Zinc ribbon domain protein [Pelotomaculum sp. PtaB.Bin013]|uniref:Zinc ribbon domain-containing protein n=1 Tax=Pelotomaculum isophthalicicum JI TaxID=947010 RepID=A0A9X4H0P3_9FIRM|nr:zinc ribbon domain-containing protein [Pelotomaculum isophthalicicum]MDF9406916.1 zinc ribbon domain-containing protein [Pelotomaculum isophthalicicum JI]OPX91042.1 MAG: Zinc ribbon domain protein [Pelotomaculum sp. PtaB.Bin013]